MIAPLVRYISRFSESGEWRVSVRPRAYDFSVEIWLTHVAGKDLENATVDVNGLILLTKVEDGDSKDKYKPFLVVPIDVWQLLVDAITETTPPTKKERIEGELDATKYHLEDLRKLLKINL